jgi:serine/threonine-protein kinase
MGTPAYLAPEQARDSRNVDIRADIYSLGCTLYHLLTGQIPFQGNSLAELVLSHQLEDPAPLDQLRSGVSRQVEAIVQKMMAKKTEDRYQTPLEVAEALQPLAMIDEASLASWRAEDRHAASSAPSATAHTAPLP